MYKMYKILAISFAFCLFAGTAMAANLADTLVTTGGAGLSSGVMGDYYSDAATTTFIISDKNQKGRYAYATGSTTTSIFRKLCATDPCGTDATADLIGTAPSDVTTYTFDGDWGGAVLGSAGGS